MQYNTIQYQQHQNNMNGAKQMQRYKKYQPENFSNLIQQYYNQSHQVYLQQQKERQALINANTNKEQSQNQNQQNMMQQSLNIQQKSPQQIQPSKAQILNQTVQYPRNGNVQPLQGSKLAQKIANAGKGFPSGTQLSQHQNQMQNDTKTQMQRDFGTRSPGEVVMLRCSTSNQVASNNQSNRSSDMYSMFGQEYIIQGDKPVKVQSTLPQLSHEQVSSSLQNSPIISAMNSQNQSPNASRIQIRQQRPTGQVTQDEKQNFKNQFDAFKNIYQGEQHKQATKSIDGQMMSQQKAMKGNKEITGTEETERKEKRTNKALVFEELQVGLGQGNTKQENVLDINISEIGATKEEARIAKPQGNQISQDSVKNAVTSNGEKVKQLKQFIYMVDLFNVMENESKQDSKLSPGGNFRTQMDQRENIQNALSQEHVYNQMTIQENNSSTMSTAKDGAERLLTDTALNQRYQAQSVNSGKHGQSANSRSNNPSSQVSASSQIDANMWKHFQNLLKKNYHNPYLREALSRQNSGGQFSAYNQSQQQVSRNLRNYLKDLTHRIQNGLVAEVNEELASRDIQNQIWQESQKRKQLHQLNTMMQTNSSFASLIDKSKVCQEGKSPNLAQSFVAKGQSNTLDPDASARSNRNSTQIRFQAQPQPQSKQVATSTRFFSQVAGRFAVGKTQASQKGDALQNEPSFALSGQGTNNAPSPTSLSTNGGAIHLRNSPSPSLIRNVSNAANNLRASTKIMQNIIVNGQSAGLQGMTNLSSSSVMKGGLGQDNHNVSPLNFSNAKFQYQEKPQTLHQSAVYKMTPQGSFLNQQNQTSYQSSSQFNLSSQERPSQYLASPNQTNMAVGVHGQQMRQHQRSGLGQVEGAGNPQQSTSSPQQLPLQISSTLFIMDCQTFGILSNQKLLKLGPQSYVPGTSVPSSSNYQLSEAQMVNFVMNRAQTCSSTPNLELPKLSEESKRILNTIKAQQHLNMVHEIQKIDTLIIEMDYFDYKNQILQPLFQMWGNKVLANLVHRIEPGDETTLQSQGNKKGASRGQTGQKHQEGFQTIHQYIDKIRKHHDDSIKLGNLQQQQLFSQINDFDSGNENHNGFESFELKSRSATRKETMLKDTLAHTRSSEGLGKNARAGLDIASQKQASEQKQNIPGKLHVFEVQIDTKQTKEAEENFQGELLQLFPKKYQKRQRLINQSCSSNEDRTQEKKSRRGARDHEKKLKKKINFHVLVKNTKLYQALKFMDEQIKIQNQREILKNDAEDNSKGPLSVYQLSSEMSHQLNDLSSFIQTKDCSILRFALYCSQVGIVNSAQQLLRQFFKNIYIVIKPGTRTLLDGSIQHLRELPKIDIDKINKYLLQSSLKRSQQAQKLSESLPRKSGNGNLKFSEILPGQDIKTLGGSRNCLIDGSHPNQSVSPGKAGFFGNKRYEKGEREGFRKNFSLNSFKSARRLNEQEDQDDSWLQTSLYSHHFNSGSSHIRVDGAQGKTTIKLIHKPFTHLDNSRIQKCFKIYNEFVQLVLKNRAILVQNKDSNYHMNELSKSDASKIYKLAYHMGIRLPKKNAGLLGRSPLLDALKNHRSLSLIKEQMVRFVHRVLNEENGISHNIFQCVIMGSNFENTESEKTKKSATNPDAHQEYLNQSDNLASVGQFVTQTNSYYRYQVGLGNNHQLIRSLLRQRVCFHHINRDKNLPLTAVQKIDFDEAQIMWTQWRKLKLFSFMTPLKTFQNEFGDLLRLIGEGKIALAHPVAADKYDKSEKKGERERPNEKIIKIYTHGSAQSPQKSKDANLKYMKKIKPPDLRNKSPIKKQGKGGFLENVKQDELQKTPEIQRDHSPGRRECERDEDDYSDDFEKTPRGPSNRMRSHTQDLSPPQNKATEDTAALVSSLLGNQDLKTKLESCKRQMQKIYNRLEFNQHLNNKKALFINMRNYYTYCCENEDVFNTLPLTFHIKSGQDDPEYAKFTRYYQTEQAKCSKNKHRKNIWIIKPGENSNRGSGIRVEQDINKIRALLQSYCSDNGNRTMILQKYIDNPLLYQRRKFDFRCFALVTCHHGQTKAFFYRDGYLRTSSKEYIHNNLNLNNKYVHLVNDAVQKYSEDYGKYEPGNKLSYQEFQKYLTMTYPDKLINLERDIIMQIKKIVTDTIRATFHLLDSKKRMNSYELFGYDFMFDDEFKPFLIEVNSNPSLEPSCNILTKLFTQMLDNTFRIGIDPLFPPNDGFSMKKGATGIEVCPENRFDLIFDERIDGPELLEKFKSIGRKEKEEVEDINELSGSGDEAEEEADADEGELDQEIDQGVVQS